MTHNEIVSYFDQMLRSLSINDLMSLSDIDMRVPRLQRLMQNQMQHEEQLYEWIDIFSEQFLFLEALQETRLVNMFSRIVQHLMQITFPLMDREILLELHAFFAAFHDEILYIPSSLRTHRRARERVREFNESLNQNQNP